MAESVPTSLDGVTSLYRRFRPGRFAELRGQDHVVRALQGAVQNNRVSHAYLFSGPRGTGKTTTARILAKALNCANPVDGDACNQCASCVAITNGSSLDVTELDAASNNGVAEIRDITAGAWHGTPGRWKVYIFDEVHQLSRAASAALLKTLEEPPSHVVFVLATTDPHKVLPTIRSRTQHLEFRLLAGDTLQGLLRDVQSAAGLGADSSIIETAVRLGRGSARDALSALDQLVATGSVDEARPDFDRLFDALVSSDAARALEALSTMTSAGWDPEQLAESFAAELRQAFLLQVAPQVADAVDSDRERLTAWGSSLGLARSVRSLETMGRAMREMKSAPDRLVILEVALVRLTRPDLDQTYESIDERLTRLERSGVAAPPTPPPPAPVVRPIGQVEAAERPHPSPSAVNDSPSSPVPAPTPPASSPAPSAAEFRQRFVAHVVPRMSRGAQMFLSSVDVREVDGNIVTFALSDGSLRPDTDSYAGGLKKALVHEFKQDFELRWVVDSPRPADNTPTTPATSEPDEADEEFAEPATSIEVDSVPEHLIAEFFPGAKEVS
jgi:DNA polymerase III subunit gamma/tau